MLIVIPRVKHEGRLSGSFVILGLSLACHPRTSEAQIRGSRHSMLDPRVKPEDDMYARG